MIWTTILLALTLLKPAASVPDISGSWAIAGEINGQGGGAFGSFSATCTFQQQKDGSLSGVCMRPAGDVDVSGQNNEQGIGFQYDVDRGGATVTFLFNGTLDKGGTGIAGAVAVLNAGAAGGAEGTFTAKKQGK